MKDVIKIEIDYSVLDGYDNLTKQSAAINELLTVALENGRLECKEKFNIQLTILDCK